MLKHNHKKGINQNSNKKREKNEQPNFAIVNLTEVNCASFLEAWLSQTTSLFTTES